MCIGIINFPTRTRRRRFFCSGLTAEHTQQACILFFIIMIILETSIYIHAWNMCSDRKQWPSIHTLFVRGPLS